MAESWRDALSGDFEIGDRIGEGGCGQVFHGTDRMLERPVAIKVLHLALASRHDVAERFRSEARTLARLAHPNIATLFRFHCVADTYVMVMEFVEGKTFEELLKSGGPMNSETAILLLLQALEGLDHAHRHGVIHRDIKATNLMVNLQGVVKVMDFGIARALDTQGLTQVDQPLGTPEYMSPEQVRGEVLDARSDIYSLGILFYKMLSGRLPLRRASSFEVMRAHLEDEPPPVRSHNPKVPVAVEAVITQAMAKDREQRFASAIALRVALEEIVEPKEDSATPPPPLPEPVDEQPKDDPSSPSVQERAVLSFSLGGAAAPAAPSVPFAEHIAKAAAATDGGTSPAMYSPQLRKRQQAVSELLRKQSNKRRLAAGGGGALIAVASLFWILQPNQTVTEPLPVPVAETSVATRGGAIPNPLVGDERPTLPTFTPFKRTTPDGPAQNLEEPTSPDEAPEANQPRSRRSWNKPPETRGETGATTVGRTNKGKRTPQPESPAKSAEEKPEDTSGGWAIER